MFTISDPLSFPYLATEVVWLAIGALLVLGSGKVRSEWVKGSLAALGLAILGLRLLAVLPSWWLYYADAELGWGGNGCTAIDPTTAEGMQCLKQTAKDLIVVIENGAVLVAFGLAFILYQKRFPKQLAPGEAKPEATGGYK